MSNFIEILAFPARAKKSEAVGVEASDRTPPCFVEFVFALAPIYARTEGG